MHNLALSLAQHADGTLEISETVLESVVHHLERSSPSADDVAHLHRYLLSETKRSERIQGIFVYDQGGRWITSSLPIQPLVLNNSDRSYFRHHQRSNDRASYIGPPVQSKSDGNWIMTLSRRFDQTDGQFGGVALVSTRLKYFSDFYLRFNVGNKGSIALVGTDGTLYARRPYAEQDLGTSIIGSHIYDRLSSTLHGTARFLADRQYRANQRLRKVRQA